MIRIDNQFEHKRVGYIFTMLILQISNFCIKQQRCMNLSQKTEAEDFTCLIWTSETRSALKDDG